MGELEFTDRKWENLSLQIESLQKEGRRTKVCRKNVGELEFIGRKLETWRLQIESERTRVYR